MEKIVQFALRFIWYGIIAVGLFSIFCNVWIRFSGSAEAIDDIKDVPYNQVALVLGTAQSINGRSENPYFAHRMEAAARLYKSGKVKHLILSGDNSREHYNEPQDMKDALIKKGIPASAISLDFAGFRTLDSVVRCKEIFGQKSVTIVSQKFHNLRSIFIAKYYGLEAVAYNAADVQSDTKHRMQFREYLARVKAVLDLYILKKSPKFMGEKIHIEV